MKKAELIQKLYDYLVSKGGYSPVISMQKAEAIANGIMVNDTVQLGNIVLSILIKDTVKALKSVVEDMG